ncbi:MAG: HU family DNA-binding protein [Gemmatimonadetes bacterium]|nr:HU family DNA-binding protein [Gemmatimonadota bacterium]
MNKSEMAKKLAQRSGLTQAHAADVLEQIFSPATGIIADALDAGGKVGIGGFGSFEVRRREARTGRNPRTGETIPVPARNYPAFKPAKNLKDRVG